MNHPLSGCVIKGPLQNPPPDFSATAASLRYQSDTLGISLENDENNNAFSFAFKTPQTSPVICEITRWDDASNHRPVTENIVQAACGLMSVHGRAVGRPRAFGVDYISTLTATLALQGAAAAAIGQLRGLAVSKCSVSMAAAALLSVGQYLAGATAAESPEQLRPGMIPQPACPPFISADGVIFELETLDAGPWQKFWLELGVDSQIAGKGWTAFLLRYARAVAPLPAELSKAIAGLRYSRIADLCAVTGMAICPVRSIDARAQDQDCKRIWLQGPWEFAFGPVLNNAVSNFADTDLPLSGLTVIESCRRIQGPLAGHLLALLGADVIRIEPPGGDPLRGMPPMAEGCSTRFDALNRHKIIREIDIKSSAGQAEIKALVKHADVFLHNWAPGKAAPLNLDYQHLASVNPALIYAYAGGWATNNTVTGNSMPGTDFMAQAYSGVAGKIAEASGTQGGSLFTVLDVLGGAVAAQGITIALLNRCLNKAGGKVTSSLMSAATLLCSDDLQKRYQTQPADTCSKSLIDGVYLTGQGYLAIECYDLKTTRRLAETLNIATGIDGSLDRHLSDLLLSRPANQWFEILEQADIPSAVVIEDLADLQNAPYLKSGLTTGSYTKVTSPWRFK
ncbi:MAG: CoA transferase [Methylobacter sp.]